MTADPTDRTPLADLERTMLDSEHAVCDVDGCERTDTQPAWLQAHGDDGTELGARRFIVCPDHVQRLIAWVNSYGPTRAERLEGEQ